MDAHYFAYSTAVQQSDRYTFMSQFYSHFSLRLVCSVIAALLFAFS